MLKYEYEQYNVKSMIKYNRIDKMIKLIHTHIYIYIYIYIDVYEFFVYHTY